MMNNVFSLSDDEVRALDLYWRAANYLGAAQIYLRDNCLLTDRLRAKHIKPRLLGHWGAVPGINFVYTHLNRLIRRTRQSALLVTGPGHGAPGNLANLYLEGTLAEFYPELSHDKAGAERLIRMFSTPGGVHGVISLKLIYPAFPTNSTEVLVNKMIHTLLNGLQ